MLCVCVCVCVCLWAWGFVWNIVCIGFTWEQRNLLGGIFQTQSWKWSVNCSSKLWFLFISRFTNFYSSILLLSYPSFLYFPCFSGNDSVSCLDLSVHVCIALLNMCSLIETFGHWSSFFPFFNTIETLQKKLEGK